MRSCEKLHDNLAFPAHRTMKLNERKAFPAASTLMICHILCKWGRALDPSGLLFLPPPWHIPHLTGTHLIKMKEDENTKFNTQSSAPSEISSGWRDLLRDQKFLLMNQNSKSSSSCEKIPITSVHAILPQINVEHGHGKLKFGGRIYFHSRTSKEYIKQRK